MTTKEAREAATKVIYAERMRHFASLFDGPNESVCRCGWTLPQDHGLSGSAQVEAWEHHIAEAVLDALLAATQEDGAPLVLLAPEQVGVVETLNTKRGFVNVLAARSRPGFAWPAYDTPLFRAPFIEAQREEA